MKSTLEDEKLKDKIGDSDKEAISKKCDETIKWLDANQLAEVDEFQDKQKEVEGVCNPIIATGWRSSRRYARWNARRHARWNAWRHAWGYARCRWCPRRCRWCWRTNH